MVKTIFPRVLAAITVMICVFAIIAFNSHKPISVQDIKTQSQNSTENQFATFEHYPTYVKVSLLQKSDKYILFSLVDSLHGGGVEAIVVTDATKKFRIIWQGQDSPSCSIVNEQNVPVVIDKYCILNSVEITR